LQTKSKEDLERISNADLMPKYYIRKQKIDDSIRAFQWFKITKDSSYIKKYVLENPSLPGSKKDKNNKKQNKKEEVAIWNDERTYRQKQLART
jgi:penicillin-binding protein 2